MRVLCFLFLLLPTLAFGQGAATLVADTVTVEGRNQLIAEGNIEVLYDGARLTASRIVFDRNTDSLSITGPLILTDKDGTIFTATAASLDPTLQSGILRGARLVLDQQLQLAANQISRSEGRYSQLYKVAATSCHVCGDTPPLWSIRAERVVHDTEERQLYFTNATLRLRDTPIFWLPRMRLPDPSLTRATGFLIPSLRTTDQLGTGIKTPYFIRLGDHRDLTLTPYLSSETTTLQARYRQAFVNGDLQINTAASRDTLEDDYRAYLFAEAAFDLSRDFELAFDIEGVTDRAYLLDYGYSSKDRLDSAITVTRIRDDELIAAGFTAYQSLRDDEVNSSLPPLVADFIYEKRTHDPSLGTFTYGVSGDALIRTGVATGDAGRDLARLGGFVGWDKSWIAPFGVVTNAHANLNADVYNISDDASYPDQSTRVTPTVGVTLRYPLAGRSKGAAHLVEPVIALAWSDAYGDIPPNEDSVLPELDQASLFAADRLPGEDVSETGLRTALGVNWTRKGDAGVNSTLTFGRVFRENTNAAFTDGSGQSEHRSDWLVTAQIAFPQGISVAARSVISETFVPTLTAARLTWQDDDINLAASYIWQVADTDLGRDTDVSEWSLDTDLRINDAWTASFDTQYDAIQNSPTQAGLGLQWKNECMVVDLSVSRRFTSSDTVEASTDYGLAVTLSGFSTGRSGKTAATQCNNG